MKCLYGIICMILITSTISSISSASPLTPNNYGGEIGNVIGNENFKEWLDTLYERELVNRMEENGGMQQRIRKAGRSPSLRLRFGRRSDPALYSGDAAYLMHIPRNEDN